MRGYKCDETRLETEQDDTVVQYSSSPVVLSINSISVLK